MDLFSDQICQYNGKNWKSKLIFEVDKAVPTGNYNPLFKIFKLADYIFADLLYFYVFTDNI